LLRFGRDVTPTDEDPDAWRSVFTQDRSAFTWRAWHEIEGGNPAPGLAWYEKLGYRPLGVAGGLAKLRRNMHQLDELARQNGAELWILIYPWPAQVKFGQTVFDWEKFAHTLCDDLRCRGVVNTFPTFRSRADADPRWYSRYFTVGDVHFNANGNRIIADALLRDLAESLMRQRRLATAAQGSDNNHLRSRSTPEGSPEAIETEAWSHTATTLPQTRHTTGGPPPRRSLL
jgi:hypothetical protein